MFSGGVPISVIFQYSKAFRWLSILFSTSDHHPKAGLYKLIGTFAIPKCLEAICGLVEQLGCVAETIVFVTSLGYSPFRLVAANHERGGQILDLYINIQSNLR